MAENKKQHIVPRFYLKGFSKDGERFFQFSAKTRKCVGVNIKDVCTRNYFYDMSTDVDHKFEKTIAEVESYQDRFLQSFLYQVRESKCNLEDYQTRFELMHFMLFMNARGFNARENTTKAITEILNLSVKTMMNDESFRKEIEEKTGKPFSLDPNKIKACLTKTGEVMWQIPLFEHLEYVADYLCSNDFFHLFCIKKDKDVNWKSSFFTSDNPVYYKTLYDNDPYGSHGLLLPGTIYYMPLAHDVFAIIGDNDYRHSFGSEKKYEVSYLYTSNENNNYIIRIFNQIIIQASSDYLFSIDSNVVLPKMLLRLHERGMI